MDPYATPGQARIRLRDIDGLVRTRGFLAAASLAELERQRAWQAEAEVERLLKQHGVTTRAAASLAARLRQAVGAALVRAGERLAGVPRGATLSETAPAAGTIGTDG
jgi:hypothetical protein